jgi:hypothetical protein
MWKAVTFSNSFSKRVLPLSLLLLLTSTQLLGVVLDRQTVICPVCAEKNEFFMIVGFGGYVYRYPPKYYRLGWGYGYPAMLWVCKHCHYAAWVWDFPQISDEQIPRVREALKGLKFANFNDYSQVPLRLRLELAEQCAKAAGKDNVFWSEYYRAQGYHLGRVGKVEEAKQSRIKARDLLAALSRDSKQASERKQFLFSLATVEHFLGNDPAALAALAQAREERLADPLRNEYLNHDIDQYTQWIKTNAIPEDRYNHVPYPLIFKLWTHEASED